MAEGNRLLLIMGDLATGKSTFATMLSKRYGVNVFQKDSIKEILGDSVGFSNREENLKLSRATMELMLFLYSEFAKLNKPLILEANFHKTELERIHEIAAANDYEVLTLVLRGDIDILHKRYLNRIYNENRHPVHLSTTLDVFDDFKEYTESTRKEAIDGNIRAFRLLHSISQITGRLLEHREGQNEKEFYRPIITKQNTL